MVGYSPWSHKELDTVELTHTHIHTHTHTLVYCKLTFLENAFPSEQLPCIYMCMPGQQWCWWKERECLGHFLCSLLRKNKIQLCALLCRMPGGSPWQNLQCNFHREAVTLKELSYKVPDLNSFCTRFLVFFLSLQSWDTVNNLFISQVRSDLEDDITKCLILEVELALWVWEQMFFAESYCNVYLNVFILDSGAPRSGWLQPQGEGCFYFC